MPNMTKIILTIAVAAIAGVIATFIANVTGFDSWCADVIGGVVAVQTAWQSLAHLNQSTGSRA